jgi:hypothetical protein
VPHADDHLGAPVGQGSILAPIVARGARVCHASRVDRPTEDTTMAKGLDKKKEQKKKPAKTLKEKRAEKNDKKTTRGFTPT